MEDKQESFRAYLDESEDSSGGLYVVGGFVGEADVWLELEPKWNKCLPAGILCFHTTDCVTGNNEFEGMPMADRAALLDNLTALIVAHEIWLISYAVDAKAYKQIATKPKKNEFLMNKYAAPFGGLVEQACLAMGNVPGPSDWEILTHGDHWEKCAFFIEKSEYDASAAETISGMRIDPTLWFRNRIGRDTYGTKSGPDAIPLLQVADFGAYLAARHRSNAPEGKISWKTYYDKMRNANRVRPTILADSRSLELLNKMLQDEKKRLTEGI
jgi:hypothetical protein